VVEAFGDAQLAWSGIDLNLFEERLPRNVLPHIAAIVLALVLVDILVPRG
jgi:hypothetical protein